MSTLSSLVNIAGAGGKGGGGGGTEIPNSIQSKEMLSFLDLISEGPIGGLVNGAQSIYFNNTPLQNADGTYNFTASNINNINDPTLTGIAFAWDSRNGSQDQTPITGFSDVENPIITSVQVKHGVPYTFTINNPNVDAIRLIVQLPALMSVDQSNGNISGASVDFSFDVAVNSDPFTALSKTLTINGKTNSLYQASYTYDLPKVDAAGNPASTWDIRMTRVSADSTLTTLSNDTFLAGYIEITYSQLSYPNSAVVGVTIDSSQFNQVPTRSYLINGLLIKVPSNYDPVGRTYTGVWDGTFKIAFSNNPAWVMYDLLTSERYGLGNYVTPAQIDTAALYQIGQYCDETIPDGFGGKEPRFVCNCVINTLQDAYRLLSDLSTTFRGMIYWSRNLVGFSQDAPSDPVMVFTAANVVNGVFNYTGAAVKDKHTCVNVTWNDPAQRYAQAIEYVENAELISTLGIRPLNIMAIGTTSRGQARRIGLWVLYSEQYESELITFDVGLDSALVLPGEVVQIQDATRAGKRLGGRLVNCTATSATLDAPVTLSEGAATIYIRLPDGTFAEALLNESGSGTPTATVSWVTPLTQLPLPNAIWVISEANLSTVLARVIGVQQSKATGQLTITALQHNPSKYAAIEDGAQITIPTTSVLKQSVTPTPTNLAVTVGSLLSQTTVDATFSWSGAAPQYIVTWQAQSGSSQTQTTALNSLDVGPLTIGTTYVFSVVAQTAAGGKSAPATITFTPSLAQINKVPLPAADWLKAIPGLFMVEVAWQFTTTRTDIQAVEIMGGYNMNNLASAEPLASVPWGNNSWNHMSVQLGDTWYYWVRVVDTAGEYGPWYPTSATAGVSGTCQSDPSGLLTALENAIGLQQVANDLATPIAAIQPLQVDALNLSISALENVLALDSTASKALQTSGAVATANQQLTQVSTEQSAQAQSIQALVAQVNGNQAAITTEATARADADSALSQRIDTLSAYTSGSSGSLAALLQTEQTARTSGDASLAQQIQTLASQVTSGQATLSAAIQSNSQALTNTSGALASQIDSLSSAVSGVSGYANSLVQNEASARSTADSSLANQITSVQATVNGQIATVQQQMSATASAVNGLQAQYVLQVQAGSEVAGIELAAGGGSSSFTILADKFLIAQPVTGGNPRQAFVLGTVNGVTSVGVAGNMILDGAIDANSAIIQDAAIGTLKVAGHAITVPSYVEASYGQISGNQTTPIIVMSQTVSFNDTAMVEVVVSALLSNAGSGMTPQCTIYCDGTVIYTQGISLTAGFTQTGVFTKGITVGAGTHTFTIGFGVSSTIQGGGPYTIPFCSSMVLGVMR